MTESRAVRLRAQTADPAPNCFNAYDDVHPLCTEYAFREIGEPDRGQRMRRPIVSHGPRKKRAKKVSEPTMDRRMQ
jgi:hypothetical protein